jgi:hypothetical protein
VNRPGLARELALALLVAAAGAFGLRIAELAFGTALALRLCIAGCGAAFALTLLAAAHGRAGRIVAPLGLVALDLALFASGAPLALWAAAQACTLWLLRCAYFHKSAFVALADAGLAVLALGAATASLRHSGSAFLALWSFGLVQALYTLLPADPAARAAPASPECDADERFDAAQRRAEAALRRLV